MRYFYLANIYAEKPGNSSEEIFKDWSIRDSEAEDFKDQNPVEFKTLNLSTNYSHSIVAGGFELMSYTTRFTPFTLLMISFEIFIKKS